MNLLYLLKENFKNLLFDLFINHWKKLSEFVLFFKLVVIKKLKILKNTLQRITYEGHWIRPCLDNTIYGLEAYGVPSKK